MHDGCYIIGGSDLRVSDRGPPEAQAERRRADRYILLPDPTVSHQHAELVVDGGRLYLIDLGSPRGTHVHEGGARRRVYQREVEPETPVELGRWRCTIADLLAAAEKLQRGTLD
ncbi:MAG: FHA domain-containing protein [Halofilum sp. (in: g-proteobacteria)]|nr:FHA domain-containing protein [Halofilum sp. (in: g-proteobacteria)]